MLTFFHTLPKLIPCLGMQEVSSLADAAKRLLTVTCDACVNLSEELKILKPSASLLHLCLEAVSGFVWFVMWMVLGAVSFSGAFVGYEMWMLVHLCFISTFWWRPFFLRLVRMERTCSKIISQDLQAVCSLAYLFSHITKEVAQMWCLWIPRWPGRTQAAWCQGWGCQRKMSRGHHS